LITFNRTGIAEHYRNDSVFVIGGWLKVSGRAKNEAEAVEILRPGVEKSIYNGTHIFNELEFEQAVVNAFKYPNCHSYQSDRFQRVLAGLGLSHLTLQCQNETTPIPIPIPSNNVETRQGLSDPGPGTDQTDHKIPSDTVTVDSNDSNGHSGHIGTQRIPPQAQAEVESLFEFESVESVPVESPNPSPNGNVQVLQCNGNGCWDVWDRVTLSTLNDPGCEIVPMTSKRGNLYGYIISDSGGAEGSAHEIKRGSKFFELVQKKYWQKQKSRCGYKNGC